MLTNSLLRPVHMGEDCTKLVLSSAVSPKSASLGPDPGADIVRHCATR